MAPRCVHDQHGQAASRCRRHPWLPAALVLGEGHSPRRGERAIEGSFCFGLFHDDDGQVGFARVITDFATTGYLAGVFVLEEHRGHGLGVWLVETVMSHPRLQGFRVWRLGTRDAHRLYAKFGWKPLAHPDRMMEIVDPAVYTDQPE